MSCKYQVTLGCVIFTSAFMRAMAFCSLAGQTPYTMSSENSCVLGLTHWLHKLKHKYLCWYAETQVLVLVC